MLTVYLTMCCRQQRVAFAPGRGLRVGLCLPPRAPRLGKGHCESHHLASGGISSSPSSVDTVNCGGSGKHSGG